LKWGTNFKKWKRCDVRKNILNSPKKIGKQKVGKKTKKKLHGKTNTTFARPLKTLAPLALFIE